LIWDELPAEFDQDNIWLAADSALKLEERSPSIHKFAELAKNAEHESNEVRLLLVSDGLACELWLTDGDSKKRWGPLGPSMEFFGQGVYPPPLQSFPNQLLFYFEQRAQTTTRADLRARYHDLIGLRWKKFDHLVQAHSAYLEAGLGIASDDVTTAGMAVSYVLRAAELALTHNIDQDRTIGQIRDLVLSSIAAESGTGAWVAQRAADLIGRQPDVARALMGALETEAAANPQGRRNRQRAFLEASELLGRAAGDADHAVKVRLMRAESFELEATERSGEGGIIALALLSDASQLYQQAGSGADVQRLKPMLGAASERSSDEMHVISTQVDIPQSAFEDAANDLESRLGHDELLPLGAADILGLWPSSDRLEKDLDEAKAQHPFQYLTRHTSIAGDGRFQSDPDEEPARRQAQLTRHLAMRTTFHLAFAESVFDVLANRGRWSAQRHVASIRLIDEELARACEDGFRALEAGAYWTAAHALVPQVERVVRLVAKSVGIPPLKGTAHGGLRWASLDEMLLLPEVEKALGEGLTMCLRRLFVEPYGPNYRNEIAHGAAQPGESQRQAARLAGLGILSVSLRLLIARQTVVTASP